LFVKLNYAKDFRISFAELVQLELASVQNSA